MKIAIDVGGVMTKYEGRNAPEHPLINVKGVIETLKKWKSEGHEISIVSFCKKKSATYRSLKLIDEGCSDFFDWEYYVEDRFYKGDVIQHIKPDIMIDDNEAVLTDIKMKNKRVNTILFQEFNKQQKVSDRRHLLANNWIELSHIVDGMKEIEKEETESDMYEKYEVEQLFEERKNVFFIN